MKNAPTFVAVLLAVVTAGCVMSGKPKTAVPAPVVAKPAPVPITPPAPPALSIPQTQVDLPRPQPVDPAALSSEAPPPVQEVAEPPAPTRPAQVRRAPATATPTPPPVATPVPEPAPPQIQEIVPAAELKRLQDQAQARRKDAQQILDQLQRRQPNASQQSVITDIKSFLASSIDAEKRGDMKVAALLADRAQTLAKDLNNGK